MVRSYINSQDVTGLEPIIAQLVCYLYTSSLEGATGQSEAGSSSSSGGGSSVEPNIGELKRESYSNVTFEYVTSADFVNKSSSSSSQKATTSSGDPVTYFNSFIVPLLRNRKHIVTISHPYVETSPERY